MGWHDKHIWICLYITQDVSLYLSFASAHDHSTRRRYGVCCWNTDIPIAVVLTLTICSCRNRKVGRPEEELKFDHDIHLSSSDA